MGKWKIVYGSESEGGSMYFLETDSVLSLHNPETNKARQQQQMAASPSHNSLHSLRSPLVDRSLNTTRAFIDTTSSGKVADLRELFEKPKQQEKYISISTNPTPTKKRRLNDGLAATQEEASPPSLYKRKYKLAQDKTEATENAHHRLQKDFDKLWESNQKKEQDKQVLMIQLKKKEDEVKGLMRHVDELKKDHTTEMEALQKECMNIVQVMQNQHNEDIEVLEGEKSDLLCRVYMAEEKAQAARENSPKWTFLGLLQSIFMKAHEEYEEEI